MIIFKYIAKEVLSIFILTSVVLLVIFLSHQFARYLALAASGKLLVFQLVHLMLLEIPQLLILIFPLSLYLSFLLAYGRLYADHEMVVLKASGFSQKQLLQLTLWIGGIVAVPIFLFALWINPIVANDRDKLLSQISATSVLESLLPGRFQQAQGGNQIFYIEKMTNDKKTLKNIFVAQHKGDSWAVMQAQDGRYEVDPKTGSRFAVAENGVHYEGTPGDKNYTVYHFGEYGVRLDIPVAYIRSNEIDSVPTMELFKTSSDLQSNLDKKAELQWRFSMPICVFVLSFLGFAFSHVKPREGRFGKIFPAILIYIIYANFMIVGQDWISDGQISPWLGLWIIHLLLLILGYIVYAMRENLFKKYWILLWKR